jgi:hypothetical protein
MSDWVYEVSVPNELSDEFVDWLYKHGLINKFAVVEEGS